MLCCGICFIDVLSGSSLCLCRICIQSGTEDVYELLLSNVSDCRTKDGSEFLFHAKDEVKYLLFFS